MNYTFNEIAKFVEENDVKFIRLAFCDIFGMQKNISIMPENLLDAFENGVAFDAHCIKVFEYADETDMLLFPDPTTLTVLPWRPGPGRVIRFFCDIKNTDTSPFIFDSRYILKQIIEKYNSMGYGCKIGSECEFYLFKTDENGQPTYNPIDEGGYLDISPLDKCENIRREICLCLYEMGLIPRISYHEKGPGQNEIDFQYSDALTSADNFLTFKSVVKAIAARNGLFASFMPKPLLNHSGNGLHMNISLSQNGMNIFKNKNEGHCHVAESFIAGILDKAPEISLFLNQNANSYERLGKFEAPKYVSWSHKNKSQLVRIPQAVGDKMRMELRSPDPSINPYLAYAMVLSAGLYGIEKKLELPKSIDIDLYSANYEITKELMLLPKTFGEAIELCKNSEIAKDTLGKYFLDKYIAAKENEYELYNKSENKEVFYKEYYFKYL